MQLVFVFCTEYFNLCPVVDEEPVVDAVDDEHEEQDEQDEQDEHVDDEHVVVL